MNKFISNISSKYGKEIVKTLRRGQYFAVLTAIIILVLTLWINAVLENELAKFLLLLMMFLAIASLLILFFFRKVQKPIMDYILNELIDLSKYLAALDELYNGEKNRRAKKEYLQIQKLGYAQVSFLQGKFSESLEVLDKIDFTKISPSHRRFYTQYKVYYSELSKLYLNREVTTEDLTYLDGETRKLFNAVTNILQGNSDSEIETIPQSNKLSKIAITYYRGLNQVNQGNIDQAKTYFQEIAQQNSELFYVREAKQFLES
ncbi:hypothetical protein [Streptococcus loxodontisalivarius]|uniref:Tetratricopeptide (TPR) repeat protein n=1 Tax=Streptococcus loxodontisalivarius TaxID=1349415 RepID=A0ABS2PTT9_9STRE|nr:hypothetical protein [Streptococcus loxodontisalivarius]MBM7642772.1 tetratricopeptide (TPR) repeat protein [Streptococcus loxodontisalivarius]